MLRLLGTGCAFANALPHPVSAHTVERRPGGPVRSILCLSILRPSLGTSNSPLTRSFSSLIAKCLSQPTTITQLSVHPSGAPRVCQTRGEDNPDIPDCTLRAGGTILSCDPREEPGPQYKRARVPHKMNNVTPSSWNSCLTKKPPPPDAVSGAYLPSPGNLSFIIDSVS